MNKLKSSIAVISFTALACTVVAQAPPPPTPPAPGAPPAPGQSAPGPSMKPMLRKAFAIGDRKMPGQIIVAGKTTIFADVPKDVKEAYVIIQVADRPATSKTRPHKVEMDFGSIPDGKVEVTAKAVDEAGKEVWKGETTVTVDNAGKVAPVPRGPAIPPSKAGSKPPAPNGALNPPPGASFPNQGQRPAPAPKAPKSGVTGEVAPLPPAMPVDEGPEAPPIPGGPETPAMDPSQVEPMDPSVGSEPPVTVTRAYENKKYGIKLQYPAGWKTLDNTAKVKPKEAGAFWIAFSSPEKPSKMTINFRHKLLKAATTADAYVKYNTYLLDWNKVSVNGKTAFETTQGSEEVSRVVHRKLVVDGKHIWMFNCIDQSGNPEFESKAMFEQLVNSAIK